jgi:hypothetical protein
MYRVRKSYTADLTLELAMDTATSPRVTGERPIRQGRRDMLEGALSSGMFFTPTWRFAWLDGKRYRVDGQASSTILSEGNSSIPRNMKVHIDEFDCDTTEDLLTLWHQFDSRESLRTTTEVTNAHKQMHEDLHNVVTAKVAACIAGILADESGEGIVPRCGNGDRSRLIHQHKDFILWATEFSGVYFLRRASVMGAIYKSWKKNPELAQEFWTLVRDASHVDPDSPTRWLNDLLKREAARGSDRDRQRSAQWGPRAIFVKCIHAYNAWRRGERTDGKYHPDSPVPPLR